MLQGILKATARSFLSRSLVSGRRFASAANEEVLAFEFHIL
jgi:hypothetical protein